MSKVALITGGSKGIGLGIAQALIAEGYKVAIVARQDESAPAIQEVLRTLRQQGEAIYRSFDVGNAAKDFGALLDAVELELGPLTTLVNNAGMGSPARGDMLEVVPENMDRVMKVNLYGAFFLAQAAARRMLATHLEAYKSLHFVSLGQCRHGVDRTRRVLPFQICCRHDGPVVRRSACARGHRCF